MSHATTWFTMVRSRRINRKDMNAQTSLILVRGPALALASLPLDCPVAAVVLPRRWARNRRQTRREYRWRQAGTVRWRSRKDGRQGRDAQGRRQSRDSSALLQARDLNFGLLGRRSAVRLTTSPALAWPSPSLVVVVVVLVRSLTRRTPRARRRRRLLFPALPGPAGRSHPPTAAS